MRLKDFEVVAIKDTVYEFDPEAKIYLFGSRADDMKRGGDIDLFILSKKITDRERRKIKIKLYDKIGEQKIDMIVAPEIKKGIHRIALSTGV
jgi:uncharacterized protein